MIRFKYFIDKFLASDYQVCVIPTDLSSLSRNDFRNCILDNFPEAKTLYWDTSLPFYSPGDLFTYRIDRNKYLVIQHIDDTTEYTAVDSLAIGYRRLLRLTSQFSWKSIWIPRMSYALANTVDHDLFDDHFLRYSDKYIRRVKRLSSTME